MDYTCRSDKANNRIQNLLSETDGYLEDMRANWTINIVLGLSDPMYRQHKLY
jgi:hypothetical protein